MPNAELIEFVRDHPWGVVATLGPEGQPQAALVGIAATDRGEIVFDTDPEARKVANVRRDERIALVVVVHDEVTMQIEGTAGVPLGSERDRCLATYLQAYPDGRQRAEDGAVLVRIRPTWVRIADFRPASFGSRVLDL